MVLKTVHFIFISSFFVLYSCSGTSSTEQIEETGSEKPFTAADAKSVFTLRCTSCHGTDGKLGLSGAKDLSVSKMSDKEILLILQNGKNSMPAFKEIIPENQQDPIVAYIKTLRK